MAWQDKFGVARFRLANGDDLDPKDPDFWLKVRIISEGRTAGRLDGCTDLASGWRVCVVQLTGVDPVKQAALEAEAERAKPRAARKRWEWGAREV